MRNAVVGRPGETGLSVEQRKRLTIAVELVANPAIVFMDEPTSGLCTTHLAIVISPIYVPIQFTSKSSSLSHGAVAMKGNSGLVMNQRQTLSSMPSQVCLELVATHTHSKPLYPRSSLTFDTGCHTD